MLTGDSFGCSLVVLKLLLIVFGKEQQFELVKGHT